MELKNIKFFNVKNLSSPPVPDGKINSSDGIINWGVSSRIGDNNFPQQLIQDVYNSPVGSCALELWREYIQGDGFADSFVNTTIIDNEESTAQDLLNKIAYDVAFLEGMAIHVQYNADGSKRFFNHIPFEQVRLGVIVKRLLFTFTKIYPLSSRNTSSSCIVFNLLRYNFPYSFFAIPIII